MMILDEQLPYYTTIYMHAYMLSFLPLVIILGRNIIYKHKLMQSLKCTAHNVSCRQYSLEVFGNENSHFYGETS